MKQEEIRKCTKVVELFRSMMDELGDMPCISFDTLKGHEKRKKATQFEHFEGGYRSGEDGQKRKTVVGVIFE